MREIRNISDGWHFYRGDLSDGAACTLDDSLWQVVRVPHDYAISGPFDANNEIMESGDKKIPNATGGLPTCGTAWYRHNITVDDKGDARFFLQFDGVMSHCQVFLNGILQGEHIYGYSPFNIEVTDAVRTGNNVLAVCTRHHEGATRWYTGGGIYRPVRFIKTAKTRIEHDSIFVHSSLTADNATADIAICAKLDGDKTGCTLTYTIKAPNGDVALQGEMSDKLAENVKLDNPILWDVHRDIADYRAPLYSLTLHLMRDGVALDEKTVQFGIRSLAFDRDTGFAINGRNMKWQGVCLHHDLGCLGSAVHKSALRRQLELLKKIGCNAIRTSHNPPARELLELTDELGFLVIAEAFDEWRINKTQHGYGDHFDSCAEADLTAMIRAYRNHPSIMLWSMGNEIGEQGEEKGVEVARYLTNIAHREDPTRLTTAGFSYYEAAVKYRIGDGIDLPGWNYKPHFYEELYRDYPWMQYGSETVSCVSSRDEYFPEVGYVRQPIGGPGCSGGPTNVDAGWVPLYAEVPALCRDNFHVQSYDMSAPVWACPPDTEFRAQDDCPYSMGEFVWTGFDYIGEPTPYYDFPPRSSYFGIYDLAGLPKDRAYLYESKWTAHEVLHIVPNRWNFPEGTHLPVHCYSSYDRVELFVNGVSYGIRKKKHDSPIPTERYRLIWDDVAYEAGSIRAVAYNDRGEAVLTSELQTAGVAAGLEMTAYRPTVTSDGDDLAFVTIRVKDKEGRTVPDADCPITLSVEGGTLVGMDNGDQTDWTVFTSDRRRAFHGYLVAFIRPHDGTAGELTVSAETVGLPGATLSLKVEAPKA